LKPKDFNSNSNSKFSIISPLSIIDLSLFSQVVISSY